MKTNGKPVHFTILLVEDHILLLRLFTQILKDGGFEVLAASGPAEAIRLQATFLGTIHLLLSDVMMPGMSGPELAQRLKKMRPKMRILLMSTYPDGGLLVRNYGWDFIQKPFIAKALVDSILEVLESEIPQQAARPAHRRKKLFLRA